MTDAATVILGGGVTGLSAGAVSKFPVYEANDHPGGICSSYYVVPETGERLPLPPSDRSNYRFEHGGGHWLFGGDPLVLQFLEDLVPFRRYERKSAIYFSERTSGCHTRFKTTWRSWIERWPSERSTRWSRPRDWIARPWRVG